MMNKKKLNFTALHLKVSGLNFIRHAIIGRKFGKLFSVAIKGKTYYKTRQNQLVPPKYTKEKQISLRNENKIFCSLISSKNI